MEYESSIDAVINANSYVPVLSQTSYLCPSMDSTIRFDDDPIRANLARVNICFDEELMAEKVNDRLVQSKYATAIGKTDAANPQDGDVCDLFGFDLDDPAFQEYWYTPEDMSNPQAGLSDTHALKTKGVNKEDLQKI